jgi:hypothetical protein
LTQWHPAKSRCGSTICTNAGWQLIAQQVTAVLKDPPATTLTNEQLCAYNGVYSLTESILATVQSTKDGLDFERAGQPTVKYVSEVADVFFVPGAPRTRRIFTRDGQGKIVGFVDQREGEDLRWTKRS